MNVMDAIEARWSVRSYAQRTVEPEKVAAMTELLTEMGVKNAVAPLPGQTYKFE